MKIIIIKVKLRANWVHSLKEKRMILKSLVKKLQNKFNISVSEVDNQDIHQSIVIGIAGICLDSRQADSTIDNIINYIYENTDAEIINIDTTIDVY
ncbi:ylxp-like protein [[Clostridium] sordellii]|uniref:DUF503 domain-containing protein n=1 Tax=Paraclostridium sordellii TaxID=1505 RepID=UPI00030D9569|nr:DUF503 domain-containing protein [Paeniclostridium sordellii]TAN68772.1 DUF503 domain-containing protein [Paeniclostridium sordellii 8483]CEK30923.1 ylxp-like protein [[Clostridium] sordellii] [Paeniclostridium sordellii]